MTKIKNLEVTPSGIYHLRIQKNGINRRLSLKTKNLSAAKLAAAIAHATISAMAVDPNKIKSWTLETNCQDVKITTNDTPEDRASALEAVKIIAQARSDTYQSRHLGWCLLAAQRSLRRLLGRGVVAVAVT